MQKASAGSEVGYSERGLLNAIVHDLQGRIVAPTPIKIATAIQTRS